MVRIYLYLLEELRTNRLKINNRDRSLANFQTNYKKSYWKFISDATDKNINNIPKLLYAYFLLKAKTKYLEIRKTTLKENSDIQKKFDKVSFLEISIFVII